MPVFTVGHSTRSLEEFIDLLLDARVTALVDVRKLPGSTKYPHFNDDVLAARLPEAGISYRIVRVSRRTGCGADVQVLDRDYGEALRILKEGGVHVVSG